MGLTTLMWQAIPAIRIPINRLVMTHDTIPEALDGPDTSASGDPFPHVVEHHGRLYVDDGNHRVARALKQGRAYVVVRLLATYR